LGTRRVKKQRPHSCNVLEANVAASRLWHFKVERNQLRLENEQSVVPPAQLNQKAYAKDWHNLVQPRLNIAWLPANQVFLRVVQLPAADRQELLSMLEFQLEKLSPLPVAQVVWSVELLPSSDSTQQTALVCIVSRDVVEGFLGKIEEQGYLADRLEVPQINQILAQGTREDGAWIYPGSGLEANLCVVAWWSGGVLRQLQLLHLPVAGSGENAVSLESRAANLHEQLMQIAWAGELEGWLTLPVQWHLVANETLTAEWQPVIEKWADGALDVQAPLTDDALARFSAERASGEGEGANLLPVEYGVRYRQQYIDRLWMGGLGAVVVAYIFGALIYLIALNVYKFRADSVQTQVANLGPTYTNVLELKERAQMLQEQLNLKYAALDCFKTASELLPPEFTLVNLVFSRGKNFQIYGVAPQGQETNVTYYNEQMRNAMIDGRKLFRDVTGPSTYSRPGSPNINWNFDCTLNVADE
jgi:hypothetical protein